MGTRRQAKSAIGVGLILVGLLTACSNEPIETVEVDETPHSVRTSTAEPQLPTPSGFTHSNGYAYMYVEKADCGEGSLGYCWPFEIRALKDCKSTTFEMLITAEDENILLESQTKELPAMKQGERHSIKLSWNPADYNELARAWVQGLRCDSERES